MLNETSIHFFRESSSRNGTSISSSRSASMCQLCQVETVACPKHNDMWPKCGKCGGGHRTENCGIRCSFYNGLGHSKDCYWKKKDTKPSYFITNYLEVLVNDEEATLTKFYKICGANHHLSSRNRIPKRRL